MTAKRHTSGDVFCRVMRVLYAVALLLLSCACDLNFGTSGRPAAPPQPSSSDPPSRVARLSYLEGSVSFRPAGSDVWTRAVLNRPVTTGDELWTDSGARAELDLGFAAIRLADQTDFGILELSDHAFQATLTQGTVRFTVFRLEHGDAFEIDTPNVSVTPSLQGEYRVEVGLKTGVTDVLTRRGEAEVTNPQVAFAVPVGQRARVDGAGFRKRNLSDARQPDRFDQFCQLRDRVRERAESLKYVASWVVGAYDLDDCGIWLTNATLGATWTPRCVPPGWAPFRFGRWAWIEPWGWTWIDDAPWGFAPSHYGRWALVEQSWSWVPGPADGQPIYAPALAAFVTGERLGGGTVAWFPLAPNEVYLPAYRSSLWYLSKLNPMAEPPIESAGLPGESYANRLVPGAITSVPSAVFKSGRPVEGSLLAVDARDVSSTEVIRSFPPLVPEVQSLSDRVPPGVRVPRPPDETSARQVVLRRSPPPAPIPFEKRLPLLGAHPGQPLDPQTLEQLGQRLQP